MIAPPVLLTVEAAVMVPVAAVTLPAETVTVAPLSTTTATKSDVELEENNDVELNVAEVELLKIPVPDIVVAPAPEVVRVAIIALPELTLNVEEVPKEADDEVKVPPETLRAEEAVVSISLNIVTAPPVILRVDA